MISRPLYQTLHPLYLCHHKLSADITHSFEWHHTHLLCDIICTIYNVTSSPYFITLLYLWHQNLYIWNHIQYVGHIYTIHETSQSLSVSWHPLYGQHHTHSLYDITLSRCVALFALYKTSHPHFMTSNHRVYVITPTIFTLCPLYLCHHIHSINDITQTLFLRSHLL